MRENQLYNELLLSSINSDGYLRKEALGDSIKSAKRVHLLKVISNRIIELWEYVGIIAPLSWCNN